MNNDPHAQLEAIRSSPGAAFIDRSFSRTFSLNIFRANARELIAAAWQVRDPEHGLRLMAVDNREAAQHAHREINRLVHNFVTGSKTLIDHTRAFMREHYAGATIEQAYLDRVESEFASDLVSKFVQDLRNYMVHKGLPDSEMFVHFDNTSPNPASGGELTTGVRYATKSLRQWDGWTAPARAYIDQAGEHLDIHTFADSYLEKVLAFHQWLDAALHDFHAADLAQMQEMQEAYARASTLSQHDAQLVSMELAGNSPAAAGAPTASPSEGPDSIDAEINEAGESILSKVRRLDFAPRTDDGFPSDRLVGLTITNDQIIGTPVAQRDDCDGRPVVAFIKAGMEIFGLDADIFAELQPLADKTLELSWARRALSRKFIEETALEWCRLSFRAEEHIGLLDAIHAKSRDRVRALDVWVPIAHLEVEAPFDFGPATIAPISAAMINEIEAKGLESSPSQRTEIRAMFDDLRSRMQGLAAVVVHVEAEPIRAHEDGLAIAQNVVGLLRFFSPTARQSWSIGSTALLGTEVTPRSQSLVLGEDNFSFSDGLIAPAFSWRLSKNDLAALWPMGMQAASSLVLAEGLSGFALSVRASLLLFGTGTTLHNHADRLIYTLSAVEGLLIRHSMEPAEFNVEERMALLLATGKAAHDEVAKNVREAFRLRKRHGTFMLMPYDANSLAIFTQNVHMALAIALENLNGFARKTDFIDAVDRRKAMAPGQA